MINAAIQNIVAKHLKKKLNKQTITTEELEPILKEIRTSFLDADVSLKVIRTFLDGVKQNVLSMKQLNINEELSDVIIRIIKNNLIEILGKNTTPLKIEKKPIKIMMVGLNGSGKTTTCGKIAHFITQKEKINVMNVGLDIYRPAAIEQLKTVSKEVGAGFYEKGTQNPIKTAQEAIEIARVQNYQAIIFDTAGRLQTNEELMNELAALKRIIQPNEILFVVDGMAGQDIITVAQKFHQILNLTGIIITKADSDARMGAALSLAYTLNLAIKFLGTGERYNQLNIFHPDRMADRILGLGDILTLAEKASEISDEQKAQKSLFRMLNGQFDLEDLLQQLQEIKKMGSLKSIMSMLPNTKISENKIEDAELKLTKWKIIMNSMTLKERRNPRILKKEINRKTRIVNGSGCRPDDLNKLLKEWENGKQKMDEMAKMLKKGKNPFGKMGFGNI